MYNVSFIFRRYHKQLADKTKQHAKQNYQYKYSKQNNMDNQKARRYNKKGKKFKDKEDIIRSYITVWRYGLCVWFVCARICQATLKPVVFDSCTNITECFVVAVCEFVLDKARVKYYFKLIIYSCCSTL